MEQPLPDFTMKNELYYIQVVVPRPLRSVFDYLPLPGTKMQDWRKGQRVYVPFGRQTLVGIVVGISDKTAIDLKLLKPVVKILDTVPLLPDNILTFCRTAANYYHHSFGDVISHALPISLRQGKPAQMTLASMHSISPEGITAIDGLTRAPKQQQLLVFLQQHPEGVNHDTLKKNNFTSAQLKTLKEKNYVIKRSVALPLRRTPETPHQLNPEQEVAVKTVIESISQFTPFLLFGITGSGKTEVYFHIIAHCLAKQKQALVLIPEIALTPQTISRFERRFNVPIVAMHSAMSNTERLNAWLSAQKNQAKIVIGTRSALFTPMPSLGLIIIDEEHDASFKQHDGFRYHARDLALLRAKQENIPIVLGSATPSLQTLHHANVGRYSLLKLSSRTGNANLPTYQTIDLRRERITHGLSNSLIHSIEKTLSRKEQVLLFLNRRGYAPTLLCHPCGFVASCHRCDAKLTVHKKINRLHCHHCGSNTKTPTQCPKCHTSPLHTVGLGTEQLEETLQSRFKDAKIQRIDRDTTRTKKALDASLEAIQKGNVDILLGTQMLAKGHHFPNVTLVAIVDADSGFYHHDFSACERIGQLITQVAGRAGREEKRGTVILQTYQPENPELQCLIQKGYFAFSQTLLQERSQLLLPPTGHLALIRAEGKKIEKIKDFFHAIIPYFQPFTTHVQLLGPVDALLARRAGYFRMQLLVQTTQRQQLHQSLAHSIPLIEKNPASKMIRWSLDVDPIELG
jgi:primosomal protein N' (replication factor Y)